MTTSGKVKKIRTFQRDIYFVSLFGRKKVISSGLFKNGIYFNDSLNRYYHAKFVSKVLINPLLVCIRYSLERCILPWGSKASSFA